MFISKNEIENLRKKYPKGALIKCICMDDIQGVPSGTMGTVSHVDDCGTIHMIWETGSSLGLIDGVDEFLVIKEFE